MTTKSRKPSAPRPPERVLLAPAAAIMLSISLGLCGGYLDLAITLLGKYCWNKDGYFRNAAGFSVDRAGRARPAVTDSWAGGRGAEPSSATARLVPSRGLAVRVAGDLGALLRAPLYGACTLPPGRRSWPVDRRQGRGSWRCSAPGCW